MEPASTGAQSLSVKRAEVEFHNFASLGEPDHAIAAYLDENVRRADLIRQHLGFIGSLSPFLEIGANVGHTSYMLANQFGAEGFALDLSADALRYGVTLMDEWGLARAPVRLAGDAAALPFRDGALQFVLACQTLSQFMDIERVMVEVKRVLAPGGVFLLMEEPLRRKLSMRLYRVPYQNRMKVWERKLFDWGLLGYLARDVIGAEQEESFGIRQNHTMYLKDWHGLIEKHFADAKYHVIVPERGWGERAMKRLAVRLDPHGSEWRAAHLLGGALAASCKKEAGRASIFPSISRFEAFLRCPDCHAGLRRDVAGTLVCASCPYSAPNQGGVFNLLPSSERAELYPGDCVDAIDFSIPGHESRLLDGWYEVEGVFGNRYRWTGPRASARLTRIRPGPQRLRLRGFAHERSFELARKVRVDVSVNGAALPSQSVERPGVFVIEADLPEAADYKVELAVQPSFPEPDGDRIFGVIVSMIRLIPREG